MKKRLCVLFFAALGFAALGFADDQQDNRASLKGIKSIDVVVENLDQSEIDDGLTVDQLKADVELRLRKTGVNVSISAVGFLYVNANLMKGPVGLYVYNVEVAFEQPVVVLSNGRSLMSKTWSTSTLGTVGQLKMARGVRDMVADLVDRFLNAYLSVNPIKP